MADDFMAFGDADLDELIAGNVVTAATQAAEEERSKLTGQWIPLTLADAYADDSPIEFLIDGLLPIPSLSIVYGGPGSLKSMLLADLAVCVAAGKTWLEALPGDALGGVSFAVKQAPVLWLDFDNGKKRTNRRMAALGRGHELAGDASLHYISMAKPWLNASDNAMVEEVAKYLKAGGYKLLIVDNLGLVNGGIEENSSEMAQVMGLLRWLSEDAECAVIVIHHQRKGAAGITDPNQRKGDTLRGHSTIEASLDMALLIERHGREDAILAIPTKTRDFHRFDFFGALWTFEHFPDDDRMKTGRFWARSVATGEEAVNMAIKAQIKLELRGRDWTGQKALVDFVRDSMAAKPGGKAPGINKVRGLIREMVEEGEIIQRSVSKTLEYRLL
jgi:hypothetical protein